MKKYHSRVISTFIFGLALILMTGFLILFILNQDTVVPGAWASAAGSRDKLSVWVSTFSYAVFYPLIAGFFSLLIIARQPGHPVGWLLNITSLVNTTGPLITELAVYSYYTSPGAFPGSMHFAWISNWIPYPSVSILFVMVAVFPNGRFASNFWKRAFLLSIVGFVMSGFLAAVIETPMDDAFGIPNPLISQTVEPLHGILTAAGYVFMAITTLVLAGSFLARYTHAKGVERQQLKWMVFGVVLMALMTVTGLLISSLLSSVFGQQLVNFIAFIPPIAVGIGVLRYRLYDIDLIIRRTLQYSLLTGLLALVYFGGVTLLQAAFSAVSGEQSQVAVVITTLAIAALFNPLRRRIQDFIDRRFYRRKYDAEQALASFSDAARVETDLDRLVLQMVRAARDTLQPEKISVWLKPDRGRLKLAVKTNREERP